MIASAIIGGMFAVGNAIFGSIRRNNQRQEQIKQLKAQQQNMTAVHEYKKKMFKFQKKSLDLQLKQGQEALAFATKETTRKQNRDLEMSKSQALATDYFNAHQMKALSQQTTDNIASARQASATSGFRNAGSTNNLVDKQTGVGEDAMNDMQAQMELARYQATVNAQDAYANSNAQLKQYAMESQNQKDNYDLSVKQLNAERNFEKEQYEAQYNSLEGAKSYLGNYGNFVLDDIMNVGGSIVNAGLNIAGAVEQQNHIDAVNAKQDEILNMQMDYSEYSRISNANLQRQLAGMDQSSYELIPVTNQYHPDYGIDFSSPQYDYEVNSYGTKIAKPRKQKSPRSYYGI